MASHSRQPADLRRYLRIAECCRLSDEPTYTGDDIVQLSSVESLRRSPALFCDDIPPLLLMLQEAICFSSFGEGLVSVIAHSDASFSVTGQLFISPTRQGHRRPVVEELLCQTNFGCPLNHQSCQFGAVATNAFSRQLTLHIADGAQLWYQEYAFGVPTGDIRPVEPISESWQRIKYYPDYDLLPNSTFDIDIVRHWFDRGRHNRAKYCDSEIKCYQREVPVTLKCEASGEQHEFTFLGQITT